MSIGFKRFKFKSEKAFFKWHKKVFGPDKEGWFFDKNEDCWINSVDRRKIYRTHLGKPKKKDILDIF